MKYFIYLGLAICFEVFGSTMLKMSERFSLIWPSCGVIIGFLISFIFLGLSLNLLALSIAFAVWIGLETVCIALVAIIILSNKIGSVIVLALLFIVVGVVLLNKSQGMRVINQVHLISTITYDNSI